MSGTKIPFNRPVISGREFEYMRDAVARGQLSGDGFYTKRCHELLSELLGGSAVLLTTSGTHALEMAALLLDLQPGDEVVVPSFTFPSTANAFLLRGARPIFADIRPDTLNLDGAALAPRISPRTRAVVVVHYAGVACEMDTILAQAARVGAAVVEDNAHGLFGAYRGRRLGTLGDLAALSFHETKNVTCGEGGALVVNRPQLVRRAEIIREKGTNRSSFFRGEVDRYGWLDIGSSYLPADLLAAFLLAQLENRDHSQESRRTLWHRYHDGLADWAARRGVQLPVVPCECQQAYHLFYLLLPSLAERQALISHLRKRAVQAVFHYLPLHLSEVGRRLGGRVGDCPIAESASERLLRLPFFGDLQASEQDRVIDAVRAF